MGQLTERLTNDRVGHLPERAGLLARLIPGCPRLGRAAKVTNPALAVVGGLLMLAFITGISWAWAQGYSIDCGCFGGGGTIAASQTKYPLEILRDVGFGACATLLVVRLRTPYSLDRRLLG